RWCNVDFDRKVIRVREAVYEGHFSTPKTQSGQRDLPMGPLLQQVLCRHRARMKTTSLDALVFASRGGSARSGQAIYCDAISAPRVRQRVCRRSAGTPFVVHPLSCSVTSENS